MTQYTDVMIDLETLSTKPNAQIVSIGAYKFCRNVLQTKEDVLEEQKFYAVVDITSPCVGKYHIDAKTIQWWMTQSEVNRSAFTDPEMKNLQFVLMQLNYWIPDGALMWGNGADFDLTILRNAFESEYQATPWSYKRQACFRTMRLLYPQFDLPCEDAHHALSDAIHQGLLLQQMLTHLKVNY